MIMDLFGFYNLKLKKAGAILCYNQLRSLTKFFRLIEWCLALLLLFWISNRLPFALSISGVFLRQTGGEIASPIFVFLLCNAIIVTLIFKSGRLSGENPAPDNAETRLYEELLKNKSLSAENPSPPPPPPPNATEEIEVQDKETISQVNAATHGIKDGDDIVETEMFLVSNSDSDSESDSETPKVYRKWKSEKLKQNCEEKLEVKKLRRSETEKSMNIVNSTVGGCEFLRPRDELSDEEFQREVDEFIAKHLRFRRQETLAVVFQN